MFSLLWALSQCSAMLLPQFPCIYKEYNFPHKIGWTQFICIQKILGISRLEMLKNQHDVYFNYCCDWRGLFSSSSANIPWPAWSLPTPVLVQQWKFWDFPILCLHSCSEQNSEKCKNLLQGDGLISTLPVKLNSGHGEIPPCFFTPRMQFSFLREIAMELLIFPSAYLSDFSL